MATLSRGPRSRIRLCTALAAALAGCGFRNPGPPEGRPWLVVGIDGAEMRAIRRLVDEGRLPHLRAIEERGSSALLRTAYGESPVIWTTIATGRKPAEHGIDDFIVPTGAGDVPVSSDLRRVPALWNMLTAAGRTVAVFGWWASWPAETVEGVVVTDRVLQHDLERRTHPADLGTDVETWLDESVAAREFPGYRPESAAERRDLAMAAAARRILERDRPDLTLVYLRMVDIASHLGWATFEDRPRSVAGAAGPPDEVTRFYEAADAVVGRLTRAAGGLDAVNVLVVSDHGFRRRAEGPRVRLGMDPILERLGYLRHAGPGSTIDRSASRALTVDSAPHKPRKRIRFLVAGRDAGGTVPPEDLSATKRRLVADLGRITWPSGAPVFRGASPSRVDLAAGADLVVEIRGEGAALPVHLDGAPWPDLDARIDRVTGNHDASTAGVLFAAGPEVAKGAALEGIDIHDLAPTLLHALGLPYGRDFSGRPRVELFAETFRRRAPLRAIPSWGERAAGGPTASAADERLIEELRALGYLD